ncbi:unnamed protein product [Effrenium voratum]|nr:unnamed protein product [Effrenium voratum]
MVTIPRGHDPPLATQDIRAALSRVPWDASPLPSLGLTVTQGQDARTYESEMVAPSELQLPGRLLLNVWRLLMNLTFGAKLRSFAPQEACRELLGRNFPKISLQDMEAQWRKGSASTRLALLQHVSSLASLSLEVSDSLEIFPRAGELSRLFGMDVLSGFTRGTQLRVESLLMRVAHAAGFKLLSASQAGTGEKAASAGISTEEMLSACAQPQAAVTAHRLGVPVNSAYRGMPAGASGSGERMQQMPKRSIPRVAGIACSAVSWLHDTWLNLCAVAIVAAGGWLAHQRLSMRWAQLAECTKPALSQHRAGPATARLVLKHRAANARFATWSGTWALERELRCSGRTLRQTWARPGVPSRRRLAKHVAKAKAKDRETEVVKPTFDFAYWAEHVDEVQANAENRKFKCDVAEIARVYQEHRGSAFELQQLAKKRNEHAKSMKGKMEPEQRQALIAEGKKIKEEIGSLEAQVDELNQKMSHLALSVPNLTHPDTPIGDEENATVLRINGEPRSSESAGFKLRDHLEIGEMLDLFDFESGAKVSGQKFLYLKNGAALLELALVQWAAHEAVKRGFEPFIPPDLVRAPVVAGCGFAPRDGEATQIYEVSDSDLCLAGTAEIPMAGMFMNETLIASKELPKRLVAFGHAFRTEAGSSGSENRGIYRLHQFSKVELFVVTRSDVEESNKMLEEIRQFEEDLFTELGLCFRVLDMPTEELGAPAYRKFDMEAWMPGLEKWGEISSCSNCTDFQARRLNVRHKEEYNQKGNLQFAHTLNGTACAVPRMIISILETFQNEDGSVTIPKVLRPYMMGMEVLKPK